MTTLKEFRATGSDCDDLGAHFGYVSDETEAGRVYAGDCYIHACDAGQWVLVWDRQGWLFNTLAEAEAALYIYACCSEVAKDMGISSDMSTAIGAILDVVGMESLAAHIDAHEQGESLDDLCDTAPIIGNACPELDADAIDSLIGDVHEWANQNEFATDGTRSNGR